MIQTRRGFILGISAGICAPAVVRASMLMPISTIAPEFTTNPAVVGKLLSETSRMSGWKFVTAERVIDLGNGYEAGYVRNEDEKMWRLGFLDVRENSDPHLSVREAARQELKAAAYQARLAVPNGVPAGLTRTRTSEYIKWQSL